MRIVLDGMGTENHPRPEVEAAVKFATLHLRLSRTQAGIGGPFSCLPAKEAGPSAWTAPATSARA